MSTTYRLIAAISLVTLLLIGCGGPKSQNQLPADPLEAIKQINQAAQTMKSAHFTMAVSMDMDLGDYQATMEMNTEGDIEIKSSMSDVNMAMNMNMAVLGQRLDAEMVLVDGQVWMRQDGGTWETLPAAQANLTGGLGNDPAALLTYLENAKDVRRLADEQLDGVDTYHYGFTLDAAALNTQEMVQQLIGTAGLTSEQAQMFLESAVMEGEIWVGQADLLPRRQLVHMQFEIADLPGMEGTTIGYDMQVDMRLSKLNEPVEITPPTD